MHELLWFLLPVAAYSGWWVARRQQEDKNGISRGAVATQYYQGLNYLLHEQPDKAMDVFVRMLEVDSETVELHLALGNIFRKRGEVDRAIALHQNLIARPNLKKRQKELVLLELGQDYLAAGLLDRAEKLFIELQDSKEHSALALKHLVDVYEQEKDWEKAITALNQYEKVSGRKYNYVVAQFCCELAEEAFRKGERSDGMKLIKRALNTDSGCVRANIILGDEEKRAKRYKAASKAYLQVLDQDPAFINEILPSVIFCYEAQGKEKSIPGLLQELIGMDQSESGRLAISRLMDKFGARQSAQNALNHFIETYPSVPVLATYVNLIQAEKGTDIRRALEKIKQALDSIVKSGSRYRCEQCGFSGQVLHWHCPSCKSWNSIKPI